jgi:hypothetical protein
MLFIEKKGKKGYRLSYIFSDIFVKGYGFPCFHGSDRPPPSNVLTI